MSSRQVSNLNPANAVTASRFLALPVFVWALEREERQIALLAVLICGLMDLFDGWVARTFRCQTTFGEVFDAIADGLCYGSMLLLLTVYGWVPWQPVALIVGFGVITTIERGLYARRAGRTVNFRSYAMERLVGYAAYLVGFGCADFQVALFYWGYVVITTIVVAHDTKRMLIDPVPPAEPKGPSPRLAAEGAS